MCDFSQNKNSRTAKGQPDCVRCGYCCNSGICNRGIDNGDGKCVFLEVFNEELGTFSCGIRYQIMEAEKDSNFPMFDNYCSSAFMNDIRNEVIRKTSMLNR